MAKRSWRNFDYLLLGVLLVLSAYGVTMVYSATINTLGLESPVQRQIIFVLAGTLVLFVAASVDYRLLEIVQHPFSILTPFVLGLGAVGLVLIWRVAQLPEAEGAPEMALLASDLPAMLVGWALVIAVYALDKLWIQTIDLVMTRAMAIMAVIVLAALLVFFLGRAGDHPASCPICWSVAWPWPICWTV
jgi:cell division protein FtsW (lipid II flippase)